LVIGKNTGNSENKALNKAVSVNSDVSEMAIATRFWQRIGIDLLRGGCRAFQRRPLKKEVGVAAGNSLFRVLAGLQAVEWG